MWKVFEHEYEYFLFNFIISSYIVVIFHQYLQKLIISNKDNTVTESISGLATVS